MSDFRHKLEEKITSRRALVGIVGMGYVGLPLALTFAEAGFRVLGFDVDPAKVEALNDGRCYIKHLDGGRVQAARDKRLLEATGDFRRLGETDAILICVPTPLGRHREPDLSYVLKTADLIAATLRSGQLVVLESTTYPGTTREELVPRLEAKGFRVGRDVFVAFSPEREDPGNPSHTTRTIPKVVGGVDQLSGELACALYRQVVEKVVPVASAEVAEACKLLENIFRAVNIALVNEMKIVLDRMGIDIWEVISAAKTKPFGFMAFYPGPGIGGHCIPLDPFYLTWKAAEHGVWARFIELAGEVNASMPRYVVEKAVDALNRCGKAITGAHVLVLGLAYKENLDDDRESPSYDLIELFHARGAQVAYCDPYFPEARVGRKNQRHMRSVPLSAEEFARYDLVVLATAHREFRNPKLYAKVSLVVDTRGVLPVAGNVVRA
ncbi:MAG: nucleotide sugar dehydrogenase [Thermoanaerobaculum sp.]